MKEIKGSIVYQCEYCGKLSLSKGGMTTHESWCKKNPSNLNLCAACSLCEKTIEVLDEYRCGDCDYYYGDGYMEPPECHYRNGECDNPYKRKTIFTCMRDGKTMYSTKIKRLDKETRETIIKQCDKPMQTVTEGCPHYQETILESFNNEEL